MKRLIIILLLLATCGYAQVRRITNNLPTDTLNSEWLLHVVDGIDDINYKISIENFFKDSLFVNAVDTIVSVPLGNIAYTNAVNTFTGSLNTFESINVLSVKIRQSVPPFPSTDVLYNLAGTLHWDSDLDVQGLINGVKVYTALITQSGTNDPVATIVGENTIGSIVWTRVGVGLYYGTLASAFPVNKTVGFSGNAGLIGLSSRAVSIRRISENVIEMMNDGAADNQLNDTSIEIRVYP